MKARVVTPANLIFAFCLPASSPLRSCAREQQETPAYLSRKAAPEFPGIFTKKAIVPEVSARLLCNIMASKLGSYGHVN